MVRLLVIFLICSLSGMVNAATRNDAVGWLVNFPGSPLKRGDFQETKNQQNRLIFKADKLKQQSIMASVFGSKQKASGLSIIAGVNGGTAATIMLLMSNVTAKAVAEWKGGAAWTMRAITSLAKANGGSEDRSYKGNTVRITLVPPNIVTYSLDLKR